MKRFMSFLLLSALLVGCCTAPSAVVHQRIDEEISSYSKDRSEKIEAVKKIKKLTVALTDHDPVDPSIQCSAVWIGQGLLLTANHCITKNEIVTYITLDDSKKEFFHLAAVKCVDEVNDLALLLVDPATEPPHENALIMKEDPEPGEEVNIMGHTVGQAWTFSKGYVSAIRKNHTNDEAERVLQISSPAWFGNSGGGAFNLNGELVGLSSYISTAGPFLTYFIHKNTIAKFLEKSGMIQK